MFSIRAARAFFRVEIVIPGFRVFLLRCRSDAMLLFMCALNPLYAVGATCFDGKVHCVPSSNTVVYRPWFAVLFECISRRLSRSYLNRIYTFEIT